MRERGATIIFFRVISFVVEIVKIKILRNVATVKYKKMDRNIALRALNMDYSPIIMKHL